MSGGGRSPGSNERPENTDGGRLGSCHTQTRGSCARPRGISCPATRPGELGAWRSDPPCPPSSQSFRFLSFFFFLLILTPGYFFYFDLDSGREAGREGETHIDVRERHRLAASCTRPDGGQKRTCNPGTCPDRDSNLRPYRARAGTLTTEPTGQGSKL